MGELSGLGEYSSMNYCLNEIPQRVRRGLSTVEVHFTCFDVVDEFIVIGTNIGVIYWCNRKTKKIERLRPEKYGPAITIVKVVSTVDYMVAGGDHSGTVSVFVVPKVKPVFLPADNGNAKRGIERFTAADLHLSPITAMVWSANGQNLFTGDENGVVTYTEMDFELNIIKSMKILNETFAIVQLAYRSQILVVASEFRCTIYNRNCSELNDRIRQVGQKERCSAKKLGTLIGNHSSQPGLVIFSARPKQRIWLANTEGNVIRTLLFKEPLTKSYPEIQILRSMGTTEFQSQESTRSNSITSLEDSSSRVSYDIEFSFLHEYKKKYLLVHDSHSLLLLNPETTSVVAGFTTKKILSVAVNSDEIFVLEGCRRIRRLSFFVDPYTTNYFCQVHHEMAIGDKLLDMVHETSSNVMQSVIENFKKMEMVVNPQTYQDGVSEDLSPAQEALDFCYSSADQSQTSSDVIVHGRHKKRLQPIVLEENGSRSVSTDVQIREERRDELCGRLKLDNDLSLSEQPEETDNVERKFCELPQLLPVGDVLDIMSDVRSLLAFVQNKEEFSSSKNLESVPDIKDIESVSTDEILSPEVDDSTESVSTDEILLPEVDDSEVPPSESSETESDLDKLEIRRSKEPFEEQITNDIASNTSCDVPTEFVEGSNNIDCALIHSYCEKYWKQFRVPFPIKWICVSRSDVFCGSIKQYIYQSSCRNCQFKWEKQTCRASRVAISQSGSIVWKLDLGTLYALKDADSSSPWKLVARNVESVAVNDWSAWYISSGAIYVQTDLSKEKTFSESIKLKCFSDPCKICCFENNVWLLTVNGLILSRELVSRESPLGNHWRVISHPDTISISDIALGTRDTGWIVDKFSNVYFTDDLTKDETRWWQVFMDRHIYQNDSSMFWTKDKPLSVVGSNSDSIWITASNEDAIFINKIAILGHRWTDMSINTSVIHKIRWKFLAAAGEDEQTASIWCLSISNDLFLYSAKQKSIRPVEMPTTNEIVSMSAVPNTTWILTDKNEIFVRQGISERTPYGWRWEEIENSMSSFKHLSIGKDVIWALNTNNKTYAAVADLYAITSKTFVLDWVALEDFELKFIDVVVGPNKYMVWALDDKYNVYARQGILDNSPFGSKWIHVPGIKATHLTVSPSAVWALTAEGYVYRRSNITVEKPIGEYWAQIPGCLSLITASVCDHMWGVSKDTGRLTKYENHLIALKSDFIRDRTFSENIEDEWELVEDENIYQVDD